ncbi:DUF2058 domain-containing protein [Gayadomonas joobiniege]|uniref:DUF2058 domain-containing protein n=1 Tax=Gayadomonas joobiniege TaxID=1234606 RepID=UPI00035FF681|nr:DUF2058 family protein [Gayadomonas joobiniege]
MAGSLRDQLLNAGVVNEKQAKKASKKSKKNRQLKRDAQEAAEQRKAEQAAKTDEANRQIREQAEHKALIAQIKQLIQTNEIAPEGDLSYNFNYQNTVKNIRVSDKQQKQLASGFIAIVTSDDKFFMVPTNIAEKIEQRLSGYTVVLNTREESDSDDDDDPYKDYPIPDDLMW